jgi:hypothetical protein
VKVEPFYGRPDDQGAFDAIATQLNAYTDQLAQLTIQYESTDVGSLAGVVSAEQGTFLTYRTIASIEEVAVSAEAMLWEGASDATVSADVVPVLRVPVIEHQITWQGVSRPPWDLIRASSGCVNASPFLGAAEETVRFDGVTADRDFIQIDASGEPQYVWRLSYAFRERTIKYAASLDEAPVAFGWNYAYRSSAGFERLVDASGARLYPAADFSALFTCPAESSS